MSVAIVGMSGRFPRASSLAEFWNNLRDGVESIDRFSDEELNEAGVDGALLADANYVRAGTILDGLDLFDATFFGMTPREAATTDPQQRMFLEAAWEALEHAGYSSDDGTAAIGVYAGTARSTYFFNNLLKNREAMEAVNPMQLLVGNEKDSLPTSVAYHLNLHGPAIGVQTACSTSLVAVHLACQSVLNGECDMALAGGVAFAALGKAGYVYSEGSIYSKDGHCRAFDADATGTVGGSGLGIVVLKTLARALADGDTIHAVIRGSAVNNDGYDKIGYTAPSINGQASVIREALAVSGVPADTVSYIETHGTGTALGDPIEIRALQQAYGELTAARQFCAIGSLKTNIGHLDIAAGVAGLIKTVLALKSREIPPSLHFSRANPHIDFEGSAFHVNTALKPWPSSGVPRTAGVSSFGIGGTNAHVIVQEAPDASGTRMPPEGAQLPDGPHLLLLSAKTPEALGLATTRMRQFLTDQPGVCLPDLAYTSQVGRKAFAFRRALAFRTADELLAQLDRGPASTPQAASTSSRQAVFMFPGQGAQYVNMARDLYDAQGVFRSQIDACADLLQPALGLDIRDLLFPGADQVDQAAAALSQTQLTQPALFAVEYALARQLGDWGIQATAMVGHSIGEYVAACLAGVFSLADALLLVAARGRLIASLPTGAMLAVQVPEAEVASFLGESLWLAAVNTPSVCTVSGTHEAIDALRQRLEGRGIACQRLYTSHAFHSPMMDPILGAFGACVRRVRLQAPAVRFASNVTGRWITAEEATSPDYWVRHLRAPVRFLENLQALVEDAPSPLLEVGPGRALTSMAKESGLAAIPTLPAATSSLPSSTALLQAVGALWVRGVAVDFTKLHTDQRRRRIPMPTYAFDRQRHWIFPSDTARETPAVSTSGRHADLSKWFYTPGWRRLAAAPATTTPASVSLSTFHLVLLDRFGLAGALVDALEGQGAEVGVVRPAAEFAALEGGHYHLDSSDADHIQRLLASLQARGKTLAGVTHCLGLTPAAADAATDQGDCFYSLLAWAQGVRRALPHAAVVFNVVANGVQSVLGEEYLAPEKATALGACKVIPLEFPGMVWRHIDVVIHESRPIGPAQAATVGRALLATSGEPVQACRGAHSWVPTMDSLAMPSTTATAAPRDGGRYLVTGGLGGIGLQFARYLTGRCRQPTLYLTGRTTLPAPQAWEAHRQAHPPEDPVRQKIEALQALQALGAKVHYLAGDVSDAEVVRRLAASVAADGALHGVLHAAGMPGGTLVEYSDADSARHVIAPKLQGTQLLSAHFPPADLDFLWLCSSVNAIAPVVGQLDYCAANAYLDAFALAQRQRGHGSVMSINWSAWKDVGMAANAAFPAHLRIDGARYLDDTISNANAEKVFDAALSNPMAQLLVSPVDFAEAVTQIGRLNSALVSPAQSRGDDAGGPSARPSLGTAFAAPTTELQRQLAAIWEQLFGMQGIGIHDDFFELGGHSLLATQVISTIRSTYRLELPMRTLFEAGTIAALADKVAAGISDAQQSAAQQRTAFADSARRDIDAMTPEQLATVLAEKRRLKAAKQQDAANHG